MAGDLRFRLADPGDASQLGEFMARNFLLAYGHCSTPENVQAAVAHYYGAGAQERQIGDPARINIIGEVDGSWVGHAQLNAAARAPHGALDAPAFELSRFYVDASCHGKGIAQSMMREISERAIAAGARSLYLSVWKEAPQAIRFYRKEGFEVAGELVFMVGNDPKQDWMMVRRLVPTSG